MKIVESWLREWVDPDLDSKSLEHQLTMLGLEVDGVDVEGAGLDGVVVAEVVAVEKHPDADRLSVCKVRADGDETIEMGNIVIGDVWVMNGQSNMAWGLAKTEWADMELAQAHVPLFREIRITPAEYETLRESLGRLRLNDASFEFEPETSDALGFGFRCGFLGLLHLDVIQERLQREFDIGLVISAPSVKYQVALKDGKTIDVDNPSYWPDPSDRGMPGSRWSKTRATTS